MKFMKKGLAVLLAVLLVIPNTSALAEEPDSEKETEAGVAMTEKELISDTEAATENIYQETEAETILETEISISETEITVSEADTLETETSVSETETDISEAGNDTLEAETGTSETETDILETETDTPETEIDFGESDERSDSEDDAEAETDETNTEEINLTDEICFNTGDRIWSIVNEEAFKNGIGDGCFNVDGSYTINIPESNPFFPYEVQFTYQGEVMDKWFMTPDDSFDVGGHTFYVSAYFDNTAITQMCLNVSGDIVTVYPQKKKFINGDGTEAASLLPLTERNLTVDLSAYTPAELTMVSVDSIFAGDNALTSSGNIIWTRSWDDDYTVSTSGDKLNFSYGTYWNTSMTWEMIVGEVDQLATQNIRYMVTTNITESRYWLTPTVYSQEDDGRRTNMSVADSYYLDFSDSRSFSIRMPEKEMRNKSQAYVCLNINPTVFSSPRYQYFKIFEGRFANAEDAMSGTDITNQICCADMSQENAGYIVEKYGNQWVTMLTFDANNQICGCLPFQLDLWITGNELEYSDLFIWDEDGYRTSVVYDYSIREENACIYYTLELDEEYPVNGIYYHCMTYYKAGNPSPADVSAAFVGQFSSITEAKKAGAKDIKGSLFGTNDDTGGYGTDYSQGVYFTVFVGADDAADQEKYQYCIKTLEGSKHLNSGTSILFSGLKDKNGTGIACYQVQAQEDSYGEYNYRTLLVGADVDLSGLAPVFSTETGVTVYTTNQNSPEVSGVSVHDFSNGPIQYTASSEDGNNSQNYWLQVVKAVKGKAELYINSLADSNANTEVRDGVIYSDREVLLDQFHGSKHDILLVNMGTDAVKALGVELVSDVVELDNYWTLNGKHELQGFTTTDKDYLSAPHGELANFAKIRLKTKEGVGNGAEISGTLIIKSGETTLMVLNLTGTVGNPCITTDEIPKAVKYVPYGTMVQNNNKYNWNTVSYQLTEGSSLPAGMEVKANGEIYGVPTENGEFTFTVRMVNSASSFADSEKTYTLIVDDNTNENVDAATDSGYDLTQRVQNVTKSSQDSQTLVSEGEYDEFVDIYLDGEKLVEGEDYTSAAGSTRITIRNQTLAGSSNGTHTLGIEFRSQDDTLKRAAQNYEITGDDNKPGSGSETGNGTGSSGNGNNGNGGNSDNAGNEVNSPSDGNNKNKEGSIGSGAGNGSANGKINATNGNNGNDVNVDSDLSEAVFYTVESGDTLWKIAEKFYGSGQFWRKIYSDNMDIISDPDKIYPGQSIIIYPIDEESFTGGSNVDGNFYTIKPGDTLWKIAKDIYKNGRLWENIYQANIEIISNPKHIYPGQVIVIPEL